MCAYWLDTDPSLVCCHYRNEILILFDGMLHCQLASSSNSQYGCLISLEIVTIVVRRDTHSSFWRKILIEWSHWLFRARPTVHVERKSGSSTRREDFFPLLLPSTFSARTLRCGFVFLLLLSYYTIYHLLYCITNEIFIPHSYLYGWLFCNGHCQRYPFTTKKQLIEAGIND